MEMLPRRAIKPTDTPRAVEVGAERGAERVVFLAAMEFDALLGRLRYCPVPQESEPSSTTRYVMLSFVASSIWIRSALWRMYSVSAGYVSS